MPSDKDNPYVGASPVPVDHRFGIGGRDREIEDLYYLIGAEKIVVLHAPSGAGKSSLVQAGLMRPLRTRFDVWGPIRLNAEAEPAEGESGGRSRLVRSVADSLGSEAKKREVQVALSGRDLFDDIERLDASRTNRRRDLLLIFDQFEEAVTIDPWERKDKIEFFRTLGRVLERPGIWALFVIREDYLGALAPYEDLVPTHFRNRYRLELLRVEHAAEAITRPAEQAGRGSEEGRAFEDRAVSHLVGELSKINPSKRRGIAVQHAPTHGEFVEPLYLQIVCHRLWSREGRGEQGPPFTVADIAKYAPVNVSLAGFYDDAVRDVAGGDRDVERRIRNWVQKRLMNPSGVRLQVLWDGSASQGLDDPFIRALVDKHLLRSDDRGGRDWVELAHDRLVGPVRDSNAAWSRDSKNVDPFRQRALEWGDRGMPFELSLLKPPDWLKAWRIWRDKRSEEWETHFAGSALAQTAGFLVVLIVSVGLSLYWHSQTKQELASSLAKQALYEPAGPASVDLAIWGVEEYETDFGIDALRVALGRARPPLRPLAPGREYADEMKNLRVSLSPTGDAVLLAGLIPGGPTGISLQSFCLWSKFEDAFGLADSMYELHTAFAPSGEMLALADGEVSLYKIDRNAPGARVSQIASEWSCPDAQLDDTGVSALVFARDDLLVAGYWDGSVLGWNRHDGTWECGPWREPFEEYAVTIEKNADGTAFFVLGDSGTAQLFGADGRPRSDLFGIGGPPVSSATVALSDDGSIAWTSVEQDRAIRAWDLTKNPVEELTGESLPIMRGPAQALAVDDGRLAMVGADRSASLFYADRSDLMGAPVWELAFSYFDQRISDVAFRHVDGRATQVLFAGEGFDQDPGKVWILELEFADVIEAAKFYRDNLGSNEKGLPVTPVGCPVP